MRTHLVAKAHGIDIVIVARYAQDAPLSLEIIDVNALVARPSNNLATITTKTQTPDAEVASAASPATPSSKAVTATPHV